MEKSDVGVNLFTFPRRLAFMLLCLLLIHPSSTCEFDWECPVTACCMADIRTFNQMRSRCVYHYGLISVCSRPRHCGPQYYQGCGNLPFRCYNFNYIARRYGVCIVSQGTDNGGSGAGPDPCDKCQNGAYCDRDMSGRRGKVVCVCRTGFTGRFCQFRRNYYNVRRRY